MLVKNPNLFQYVCYNKMGQLSIINQCHHHIKDLDLKLEVVAFSIDEHHFVIATVDRLLIYTIKNFTIKTFYHIEKQITSLSVSNNYLLLGTDCGTVLLTNIESNDFFPIKEQNSKIKLSYVFFPMDLFSLFNVNGKLSFYKISNLNFIQSFEINKNKSENESLINIVSVCYETSLVCFILKNKVYFYEKIFGKSVACLEIYIESQCRFLTSVNILNENQPLTQLKC